MFKAIFVEYAKKDITYKIMSATLARVDVEHVLTDFIAKNVLIIFTCMDLFAIAVEITVLIVWIIMDVFSVIFLSIHECVYLVVIETAYIAMILTIVISARLDFTFRRSYARVALYNATLAIQAVSAQPAKNHII